MGSQGQREKTEEMTVGSMSIPPGSLGRGSLTCAWMADSSALEIPLLVVNGAHDGPRLWVNSTMHGPEIPGIEVIRRFVREDVDPLRLRGSIIAAPIASPLAFRTASYFTPLDGTNLATVFDGGPCSSGITRRIGRSLYELAETCDCVIDLHANREPAMIFTIVPDGEGGPLDKSLELADCFGVTTLRDTLDGYLVSRVAREGKPSLVVELTSWQRINDDAVAIGVEGLLNVCAHLGMLDGPPRHLACARTPVARGQLRFHEVFSDRGGIVSPAKTPGDEVHADELLALVRNPYGDVVEEVRSPAAGWLLGYPVLQNQSVFTGDPAAYLAVPIAAERGGREGT